MTEPSFPPELLREIGDLRRRVYELERRRQPPTDVMLKTNLRLEDLSDVSIDDTALADEDLVAWSDTFQVWRSLPFPTVPGPLDPSAMPSVTFASSQTSTATTTDVVWSTQTNLVGVPDVGISGGKIVVNGGPHLFSVLLSMIWDAPGGAYANLAFTALDDVSTYRANGGRLNKIASSQEIVSQIGYAQASWLGLYDSTDIISEVTRTSAGGSAVSQILQCEMYVIQIV